MKSLETMLDLNSESTYQTPMTRPKFTLNGKEYEVRNYYTKEEMKGAEYLILRDSEGYDSYYQTDFGVAKENERALIQSGLSKYIEQHTIERYTTEKSWQKLIKDTAIRYIDDKKGWFVICGQSGSGKTHICNAIAITLMRQGLSLKHMTWFDEVNKLKYNMKDNYSDMDVYSEKDILYIDDFLKTRSDTDPSDIEIELAYQILDARYRKNKLTIISTEKSIEQISRYDAAVHGRIIEMSKGYLINLGKSDGKNYRLGI